MPSVDEARGNDSGVGLSITQAEVTDLVEMLLGGKVPGMGKVHPNYLSLA